MATKKDEPFDPAPARHSLGEALVRMRGKVSLTEVARRIPAARPDAKGNIKVGIPRQALMELEGVTCPTCKGSGHIGKRVCSDPTAEAFYAKNPELRPAEVFTCGGSGRVYKGNPTLDRIEAIAAVFGVVPEVVFVYPDGHPLAGQLVMDQAPGLEGASEGEE